MSFGYPEVTPHVGVWIETGKEIREDENGFVTPHVGVWIETRGAHVRKYGT